LNFTKPYEISLNFVHRFPIALPMAAIASVGGDASAPFAADEKREKFEIQWQPQSAGHEKRDEHDIQWHPQSAETSKRQDIFDVATCSNPGLKQQRRKGKRKSDSLSSILCAAIVQHQLGTYLTLNT